MSNLQINDLSDRELDILKLVATGASNKEIAQKLFISSNTVKVHLRNIFSKINATSRTEAAMYAVRIGLVENTSPQLRLKDQNIGDLDRTKQNSDSISDLSGEKVLQNKSKIRQGYIYAGFFVLIIAVIAVGTNIILNSINPRTTPIPPTSTPRVQWFELSGLPTPRQGLAAVSYENYIYAIGGETTTEVSNQVEKYNPQENHWSDLSLKPTAVADVNAAVIGGMIYVPGGRLSSGMPTDITEIYDPETDQWSTGKPLPEALSAYSLAVYEGKMYIFGGWNGKLATDTVYIFDPHDDTWSTASPMLTARAYSGAAVIGGKIYIIGGWDGKQALTECEVFRPDLIDEKREWTTAPSLPYGRYGMGVANLADMVFVIGGTNRVEDPATIVLLSGSNEWSRLDSPIQIGWSDLTSVVVGSRLYAIGGKRQEALVNQMWSYQAIYTITLPIVR